MGIAEHLAFARQMEATEMPETGTNSRTSASFACAVILGTGELRDPDTGRLISFSRWKILAPIGTAGRGGDTISVTGFGTYTVIQTEQPRDFATCAMFSAALETNADGSSGLPSNATVTFQKQGASSDQIVAAPAFIDRPNGELIQGPSLTGQGGSTEYTWLMTVDPRLRYPNSGTAISKGDSVIWSGLSKGFASVGRAILVLPPNGRMVLHISDEV